jgi:CRP/FNR family cyclic AMP-dependent transcriptional regulator
LYWLELRRAGDFYFVWEWVGAMLNLTREQAERVMSQGVWLSSMASTLRTTLWRHAQLLKFSPGQIIYRHGETGGGMYRLVAGSLTVNAAPPDAVPRLIHLGKPGTWTGEGPFLTGQPRRIELRALGDAWLMYLPLQAMEEIAARDLAFSRVVGFNTALTIDLLLRIVHDLQKRDVGQRIASVLHRASWLGDMPIPLSQSDLGIMANASRQQVNATMQRFASDGWVKYTYRSVTITEPQALRRLSEGDQSE